MQDAIPSAAEREYAQRELSASQEELLNYCRQLDAAAWLARAGDGGWTVAGMLEHLVIVEQRVGTLMQTMLAQPPVADWRAQTEGKETRFAGLAAGENKIEAPPVLQPTGQRPVEELMEEFQRNRAANLALAGRDDLPLKQHVRNHPVLGPLNGYQWLVVTASHTRRHLGQMRRAANLP